MHARLGWRAGKAGEAFAPLGGRADGAGSKASTTVWADVVNFVVNAVIAEGAVEAADAGVDRLRG
jgi:hypothetical protein